MQVAWKAEYNIGVAEMDSEHFRIIEMMCRLDAADGRPDALRTVGKVIDDLGDYIETHFKHEEFLMERAGYPALEQHKEWHKAFDLKVRDLKSRASLDAKTVHSFLQDWLAEHILQADRDYVPCVQAWLASRNTAGGLD